MATFNGDRVRRLNDEPVREDGRYVVYWCQMSRRLSANHALGYALAWARKLNKPLVVYEGLKLNYPWASARVHQFMLEGMRDTAAAAAKLGINYWPFVETPGDPGRGLVRKVAADACLVVTDDYPQFITPAQNRAAAKVLDVAFHAIDANGVVPLAKLGAAVGAAAHLRPRLHKLFAEAWDHRAATEPDFPAEVRTAVEPPFQPWKPPADLDKFVGSLPVDQGVKPVPLEGGSAAGRKLLADFVTTKLRRYADDRNLPDDPASGASSGLSWYLHYGHISAQEVCEAVLGPDWTPKEINPKTRNKDDFFCRDANANSYLDELVTWRDLGHHWHYRRNADLGTRGAEAKSWQADEAMPSFNFETFDFSPLPKAGTLAGLLPEWAKASLAKHAGDRRAHLYTVEQFEAADTHDELWNAAQTELTATGRMHNYLRMLWGKKVLEWSETPEEAYRTLEYLNNKYAVDGRDPNSYTGILWCFGLFDRPWPPDRPVTGSVRYMSSDNTARKFKLDGYFRYVRRVRDRADS